MSDITLDLRIPGGLANYQDRVLESIQRLGLDDQFTVVVDRRDAHQIDGLFDLLTREGFDYQPRTTADGGYYIVAKRSAARRR